MILAAILLQAATAAAAPAPAPTPAAGEPERFSILASDQGCLPSRNEKGEVVVCAGDKNSQRLPLPDDRGPPDHGIPSNRDMTGAGALAVQGTPCAASQRGCIVGFGPPIVPLIKGAVGLAKQAFAKKPDTSGRIPIPLD